MHYFDHNATAPLSPAARQAWLEAQDAFWANPSSPYRPAARARNFLEDQRARLAGFFGIHPERVVFTSGATEASNAIFGWVRETASSDRPAVAISAVEHPCVREAAKRFFGGGVRTLPVSGDGVLELARVDEVLSAETPALVSVLAASNETGVLQPWREVAERARRVGVRSHTDAVQWIGKLPLDGLTGFDFVSASGHKFGGPKGVGFILLGPEQSGFRGQLGGGQENDHRSGTEDLAGIAAMVAALGERLSNLSPDCAARDAFVSRLKQQGAGILGEATGRLPNTVALLMPRFESIRWITRLDRLGFAIGSGSACSTGKEGPSPVLRAMGVSPEEAQRALRISAGPGTPASGWQALANAFSQAESALERDEGEDRLTSVIEI